jgi:hypothetical protein
MVEEGREGVGLDCKCPSALVRPGQVLILEEGTVIHGRTLWYTEVAGKMSVEC